MICNHCNQSNPDGAAFCENCGAPLTAAPVYNVDPQPVVPTPTYTAPAADANVDPGKQQGTIALILGIVGLALGTICSCVFSCLGGFIPLVCAIIGVIMGKSAMNKAQAAGFENKNAKIGMILSIVAIVVIVIFIIGNAILGGVLAASGAMEFSNYGY